MAPLSLDPPAVLRELFDVAVAAVSAERCVPPALPAPPDSPRGRTIVLGAGKAAAVMARAAEDHWPAAPLSGLVVTRHGHGVPCRRIEVVEAAHPVPDAAGVDAARRILGLARGLGPDDLVLVLLSGGGSALLALPADGITLEDKREVTTALLRSGASIHAINAVRKHLSAVKGGRLALACAPARLVTLAISDVPGDDPAVIASGPTVPDPSTFADARLVLERYGIRPPAAVRRRLEEAADETPKPGDPVFERSEYRLIATAGMALAAAAARARELGLTARVLGEAIEGEARDVGREHAGAALRAPLDERPCVLLSGGETTVTVRGPGRGGRNSELALAFALAAAGRPDVWLLAADSDGIDGTGDHAGAIAGPGTLAAARVAGIDPEAALAGNDSLKVFEAAGGLVVTGPTRTNVGDFRAVLVGG